MSHHHIALPEPELRATSCVADFRMMSRILDSTGPPISAAGTRLAMELGIEVPEHLRPR